jgi:GTP cyclohydrolase I
VEKIFKEMIQACGEDPNREGLLETPERATKAFQFLTEGYQTNLDELVNGAIFSSKSSEMVVISDIELYSLCEHHLLPFVGSCHIAYIPEGKVLGLSKFSRIVDMFSRRLQIQETLTHQIAEAVSQVLGVASVATVINAKHFCTMMRGVEKQNSKMITSVTLGLFRESVATRDEFFRLAGMG